LDVDVETIIKLVDIKGVVSQTTKTMLLGALIATAGLWIFTMTAAMGYVTFRM
jgi:hypothetical protein